MLVRFVAALRENTGKHKDQEFGQEQSDAVGHPGALIHQHRVTPDYNQNGGKHYQR